MKPKPRKRHQPFDVEACRTSCKFAIRNTHLGKWLNKALYEIEHLRLSRKYWKSRATRAEEEGRNAMARARHYENQVRDLDQPWPRQKT